MISPSLSRVHSRPAVRESFTDGQRTLEVDAPRLRFLLIAGSVWMVAWFFGLYGSLAALGWGHRGHAFLDAFLLCWLLLWGISGLAVGAVLLWGFFGREQLSYSEESVTLRKSVLGLGKTSTFLRTDVRHLRYRPVRTDFFGAHSRWSMLGIGAGKIRFDVQGRAHSFGLGLPDEEAERLAEELANVVTEG